MNDHDIRLADGTPIWFDQPDRSEPTLDGLLTGLSRICRYHGHRPFTVLQHTLLCDQIAHAITRGPLDPMARLQVLVHDLHEAIVGDVAGPMKRHLGSSFAELEHAWERRVHALLGVDLPTGAASTFVKRVDHLALDIELAAFPVPGQGTHRITGLPHPDGWVDAARALTGGKWSDTYERLADAFERATNDARRAQVHG